MERTYFKESPSLYENSLRLMPKRFSMIKNNSFNFIVMGDSHLYEEDSETTAAFKKILDSIKQKLVELEPVFIIHTGDTIHMGNEERLKTFQSTFLNDNILSSIPIFPAIGNHDVIRKGNIESTCEFEKYIAPCEYYFDLPSEKTRFIFLNNIGFISKDLNRYEKGFTNKYLDEHLKEPIIQAKSNGITHFFICMHMPPKEGFWYDEERTKGHTFTFGYDYFMDILSQSSLNASIDGVFIGHLHSFGIQSISNIPFILTGGAGGTMTNNCYKYTKHHFLLINIYKNNSRDMNIIKYEI